jgi:hypothetical protein
MLLQGNENMQSRGLLPTKAVTGTAAHNVAERAIGPAKALCEKGRCFCGVTVPCRHCGQCGTVYAITLLGRAELAR